MPYRSPKPCRHPLCPELDCTKHTRQKEQDNRRGTAHSRGYDTAWARFARTYRINHPLCRACREHGRVTATEQVDHVIPLGVWQGSKYDESNLQPLCRACHTKKTFSEDKQNKGGASQNFSHPTPWGSRGKGRAVTT